MKVQRLSRPPNAGLRDILLFASRNVNKYQYLIICQVVRFPEIYLSWRLV